MAQWILVGLAALCCLSVGEAVTCYYCPFGTCLIPSTMSCSFGEMCETATASVSTFVGLSLKGKGCLNPLNCLSSSTETYGNILNPLTGNQFCEHRFGSGYAPFRGARGVFFWFATCGPGNFASLPGRVCEAHRKTHMVAQLGYTLAYVL
ncbi:hypothetical protein NDU88_000883 [Pleurodeles waltl]|uniref:UPAR/Ly6 domain-containing protein n=1 Tax=Pleurodeles waltl TaxID=8319 RepID=A0AAV7Q223_PLEWA|nr:hypothetical protein NDU88_000883 [Pleurodeles waltl]